MEAKNIFQGRNFREFLEKNREIAKISPAKICPNKVDPLSYGHVTDLDDGNEGLIMIESSLAEDFQVFSTTTILV